MITPFMHSCPVDYAGTVLQIAGWQAKSIQPDLGADAKHQNLHKTDAHVDFPLLCLHDFGESASRYKSSLELLAGYGISAYGYDMRGHGENRSGFSGARGLQSFQRDLLQVAALVKHAEEGRPPVLVANGMSCVLALRLARAYPQMIASLILIDPPHHTVADVSRVRHRITRLLADFLPEVEWPTRILSAKRILRSATHGSMTAGTAHELIESVAMIPGQVGELTMRGCRCLILAHNGELKQLWIDDLISIGAIRDSFSVEFDSSSLPGHLPVHTISGWVLT